MASAVPNPGHVALAALESAGHVAGVITQNVDGLHQAAGSRRVVELHGSLAAVRCLSCGQREPRAALQERMRVLNPTFRAPAVAFAPDGDADLDDTANTDDPFVVPDCVACGGVLKPDVVFFGDNVGLDVVSAAWKLFDEAEVLLVVGSSLTVWSGFRFVRRAAERALPVAIVNLGPTRGDELARVRVAEPIGEVLPRLARDLGIAL
jgi:NAD-dependent SIR2 family protein deacetylase